MDTNHVEQLAGKLVRGEVSLDQFLRELARPKTADLEEVQMRSLYSRGYQLSVIGSEWADVPPVLDASQQSIPRSGAQFLSPVESRVPFNP